MASRFQGPQIALEDGLAGCMIWQFNYWNMLYNQKETKHMQEDNKMAQENNEKERQK